MMINSYRNAITMKYILVRKINENQYKVVK